MREWPRQIPIDGTPALMHDLVSDYNTWLQETPIPKLMFTAEPGAIMSEDIIDWCQGNLTNLETVHLGKGLHFLQEDHPHAIGENVARWFREKIRPS